MAEKIFGLNYTQVSLAIIGLITLYLYVTNSLNELALMFIGGAVLFILWRAEPTARRITYDQAKAIVYNQIKFEQKIGELPPGDVTIKDIGIPSLSTPSKLGDFKWFVAVDILADKGINPYNYLYTISPEGSILSREERPEGWTLKEEGYIIKVPSPEVDIGKMPPSGLEEK